MGALFGYFFLFGAKHRTIVVPSLEIVAQVLKIQLSFFAEMCTLNPSLISDGESGTGSI